MTDAPFLPVVRESLPAAVQELPIFREDIVELTDVLRENLDGSGLTLSDLEKITVPSGGAMTWVVNENEKRVSKEEIEAVVVVAQTTRAYWEKKYGQGGDKLPDCASADGVVGMGASGPVECATCPRNQFESDGRGKACRENCTLFLLFGDAVMPIILRIPPSSLRAWRTFKVRVLSKALAKLNRVTIRFRLKEAKSNDGIAYAMVDFALGSKLPKETYAYIDAFAQALQASLAAASPQDVAAMHSGEQGGTPPPAGSGDPYDFGDLPPVEEPQGTGSYDYPGGDE